MTGEKISQLLEDIRKSLGGKDAKLEQSLRDLDTDINQLLIEPPEPDMVEEVLKQAREIEARFAVEHPTAQRTLQEIIYMLARMGI